MKIRIMVACRNCPKFLVNEVVNLGEVRDLTLPAHENHDDSDVDVQMSVVEVRDYEDVDADD